MSSKRAREPKELPLLIDERQVRRLLGKLPRDLENMVVADRKGRKLYRLREVEERLCV